MSEESIESPEPVTIVVDQGNDDIAVEAAIDAQITATVAAEEAIEAQELSEAAAELATIGATVGMAANETASEAAETAESAKSEVAQLREYVQSGFEKIQAGLNQILNPPESEQKAEVEDVRTDNHVSDGESTGSGGNKDTSNESGEKSDNSGTSTRKAAGFRRGRH